MYVPRNANWNVSEKQGPKNNNGILLICAEVFWEWILELHGTTELFWHRMKADIGINVNFHSWATPVLILAASVPAEFRGSWMDYSSQMIRLIDRQVCMYVFTSSLALKTDFTWPEVILSSLLLSFELFLEDLSNDPANLPPIHCQHLKLLNFLLWWHTYLLFKFFVSSTWKFSEIPSQRGQILFLEVLSQKAEQGSFSYCRYSCSWSSLPLPLP